MFDPWYDGSNDYEGALLRTESEPPVFGDEGGGITMENENEYGTVELNGKEYMYLVNSYLGDKEGNVYKANYDDYGKLAAAELVASLDSEIGESSLIGLSATDLPREFLEGLPIKYVDFLGIAWEDCFPVCFDEDLTVDDVLDSNSWLLWEKASGEALVVDDSYEYARPKAEEDLDTYWYRRGLREMEQKDEAENATKANG